MRTIDMIRMAVANLFSRKLRTALTILGVVIGTTSIIVMLSLGYGMTSMMERQISGWGDLTILNVYSGYDERTRKPKELTDQSIRDLEELPHVKAVMPNRRLSINLKAKNYEAYSNIVGMSLKEMEAFGLEVKDGRMLKQGDDMSIVLMGSDTMDNFWSQRRIPEGQVDKKFDPLRTKIELNTQDYDFNTGIATNKFLSSVKVVGILKEQTDRDMNRAIYMNEVAFENLKKEYNKVNNKEESEKDGNSKKKTYDNLKLKVDDIEYVKDISKAIKDMGYDSWGMQSMIDDARQELKVVQAIFGGIGGISLIVASIGIANTMVMSIYERTREIGVMKVIGASIQDIQKLFLTEAAFIGVLGGLVGLMLSTLLSFALNTLGGQFVANGMGMGMGPDSGPPPQISIIPWWLYVVALTFGALIGLISGYFPARKAMSLSAIDAIKSE